MRILFLHQNAPGQFRHLAPHLAADPDNAVVLLGQTEPAALAGVRWLRYRPHRAPQPNIHPYLLSTEAAVLRGQGAAGACRQLAREGFLPDVVVAHPGWGESLFLREVLPRARILSYCELFYHAEGADVGFIPESTLDLDGLCRLRLWNATLLLALEAMDAGVAPTAWQRDLHPAPFHPRIAVAHEGVDTDTIRPDPDARLSLPDGTVLTAADEVVTFVARHLEPHRGFVGLMRALPDLLARRPRAHAVICGGDGVSYGAPPPGGGAWREKMLAACPVDPARVHFTGVLPRRDYLTLLQVSSLHLYLTIPFVLSWSFVEALAAGCLVLGSDVAPVREVLREGENGFLVDPRDPAALAARAAGLLAARADLRDIAARARATAIADFRLSDCLQRQAALVKALA